MANKTFILHDESVNTYGFRMLTSGANLEEFRKNPVMLYNHDSWQLPIGRWENIRVEGTRILADAVFDTNDPKAKQIADKVEGGYIRMASIGAWAPEEVSDLPDLKLAGQTQPTVTRWTVREASIVPIGANHNALAMYDRKTGVGINLSDQTALIKLLDKHTNPQSNKTMSKLKWMLGLADNASSEDETKAVEALKKEIDRLKQELESQKKKTQEAEAALKVYKDAEEASKGEKKKQQQQEAKNLIDAAVRDGRIDANTQDTYVRLFDQNFEDTKSVLASLPARRSISRQIEQGAELSDTASPWECQVALGRQNFNK